MKRKTIVPILLLGSVLGLAACNNESSTESNTETVKEMHTPAIFGKAVTYSLDTSNFIGYLAYDSASDKKRPVVMIIPEWWGLNDYAKGRARQLAEMGYVAMAVDLYGEGITADNPEMATKLSTPYYKDAVMTKKYFDAAVAKVKEVPLADTNQIAGIGYCFGGGMLLNIVRLGENLSGAVSFHGSLVGIPVDKNLLKTPVLVCHGEADKFVSPQEVATFKKQMDSINAPYTFRSYPGASHAFTNPAATEMGKKFNIPVAYNAAADAASWNEMKIFFGKIFR